MAWQLLFLPINTSVEVRLILIATVALGAYYAAFAVFMNIINVPAIQGLKIPIRIKIIKDQDTMLMTSSSFKVYSLQRIEASILSSE